MPDETLGHEALKASSLRRWRVEFASSEGYGTQYVWAPTVEHVRTWARDDGRKEDEENLDTEVAEVVETSRNEFTAHDVVLLGDGIHDRPLETETTTITRTSFEALLNLFYAAGKFKDRNDFIEMWYTSSGERGKVLSFSPGLADWLHGWGPKEES